MNIDKLLQLESRKCFNYLMETTNYDENSKGYGLTQDRFKHPKMCSLAASGFAIAALAIGVENKWISYKLGKERALNTLKNIYENIDNYGGMLLHFVNKDTGIRYGKSEFSTIDTALFIAGMLVVDSYFSDDVIRKYANLIYNRIDWNRYIFEHDGKTQFYMSYNNLVKGSYRNKAKSPWIYHWSMTAEQLIMYILAAGSQKVSKDTAKALFNGFDRPIAHYRNIEYVHSPENGLFTYQYSHIFFPFQNYLDSNNFDWFLNSQKAHEAHVLYAKNHKEHNPTFRGGIFGLSASDTPKGYRGDGFSLYNDLGKKTLPRHKPTGTVAIYSMLCGLPFVEKAVKKGTASLYENYPDSFTERGFVDAINFKNDNHWIDDDYLGIDKGATLLMIDNYYSGTVWKMIEKHSIIQNGIRKLDFIRK